jgi:hypothetical protein
MWGRYWILSLHAISLYGELGMIGSEPYCMIADVTPEYAYMMLTMLGPTTKVNVARL